MRVESDSEPVLARQHRSERFLAAVAPYPRVVLVSHVNPDPDALASMLGLQALLEHRQPGKPVILTVDGMIARAENRAMVDLIPVPLVPIEQAILTPDAALVMVDSQPGTGRHALEILPVAVLDHHETGGDLEGVAFRDIRANLGATSTMVTGYLLEQGVTVSPILATALLYGIDSEVSGYPRESGPLDDGALVWLYPRADKDLLARIKNPKLPQSYFATFQNALANAFLYQDVVVSWCGLVPQPDIIAELADFFIRFDRVSWALSIGLFEGTLKLSIRAAYLGGHSGEVLRVVVDGLGTAGGHDKRAGGAIPLPDLQPETIEETLRKIRHRLLNKLEIDEQRGHRLLEASPIIQAP
ncbi:DHH family phosphoesterase [Tundrisphaera lichenicola]|uniref:DHH family phosphoesterase n=1 Tax=Tundrisphaera lichenicola TaxID=2029860 RepID=UPI003EBF78E5